MALLFGSLVVAFGLAEILVRVVAPQQLILIRPDIWMPADSVGWVFRPNVNALINTGERTVRLVTDGDGFRVAVSGRAEAPTRILLIGDSFMAAIQVDYGQSLAGLIEANARRVFGRQVAVRNTGVGGWDLAQYLITARRLLVSGEYDLVLVSVFTGNDVVAKKITYIPPRRPVERSSFRFPEGLRWREMVEAWAKPVNDLLEMRSHLYVFLRTRFQSLRQRFGLAAAYFPSVLRKKQVDSPRWSVTADMLYEIAALARSEGTPTVFVLVPHHIQVYEDRLHRYLAAFGIDSAGIDPDQPNRILFEQLTARGLTVVDALPAFRRAAASGEDLYGRVDPHLGPRGHWTLWGAVKPALVEALEERSARTN